MSGQSSDFAMKVNRAIRNGDIGALETYLSEAMTSTGSQYNEYKEGFRWCINTAIYHDQLEVAQWLDEQSWWFDELPICSMWALRRAVDNECPAAIKWLTWYRPECYVRDDFKSLVDFVVPLLVKESREVNDMGNVVMSMKWYRNVSVEATSKNVEYVIRSATFPSFAWDTLRSMMIPLIYAAHAKDLKSTARNLFRGHLQRQKTKTQVAANCPGFNFFKEESETKRIHVE